MQEPTLSNSLSFGKKFFHSVSRLNRLAEIKYILHHYQRIALVDCPIK